MIFNLYFGMSVTATVTVRDLLRQLRGYMSYREIAGYLGVSCTTVWRWDKGLYNPREPEKVLKKLTEIILGTEKVLVNDYYSDTHNGPPQHFFGLQGGEDLHIERFKRAIKKVADLLDTYNRKWIETATIIGLDYFRRSVENIRLYSSKLVSFVVACYRIAMFKIHYVYPDWEGRLRFMKELEIINPEEYAQFISELARLQLL